MLAALIPLPYRWVAFALLGAVLFGYGYVRGLCRQQALDERAEMAQVAAVRRVENHAATISAQADASRAQQTAAARVVYQTITKEVIRYAQTPIGAVRLDAQWVRDHDAASSLSPVPNTAGNADGGAGSVTAADALAVVTDNYASCNATRQQLIDLQQWVTAERAVR
jgi:hypothetical protein